MRRMCKKGLSILLSLTLVLGALSTGLGKLHVSAICCRKDYFDKSRYTLTGDMPHDVAVIAKSQKGRTRSDFGYTEGWCDEFVADCLENAGADSSIVAHGGTVADFERVMRSKGAVTVTSPKEGDLIFFSNLDHVEIVTKVVSGQVYCAGGNNGDYPGKCNGERSISGWGTARVYLRPNYPTQPTDTTPPSITDYGIIQTDSDGYTVYCCFDDNVGVTRVRFPTWTPWQGDNNGQDDLIWYEGIFESGGKSAYARVHKSEHNNELGTYVTHIYAYDAAGNCSQVATSIVIEENAPKVVEIRFTEQSAQGFRIQCTLSDENAISRVQFPTWSDYNGGDDVIWHNATINGNVAEAYISTADHNNELGNYTIHIYAYDIWGNLSQTATGTYLDNIAPIITEYGIIETGSEGYTAYACFDDDSEITRVQFPTWTPWQGGNNGQDDLIWYEGNFNPDHKSAWARILKSNHNNELGAYVTHIYVWDSFGNVSQVGVGITIEENAPIISDVTISNVTSNGYTVSCTVSDENAISKVQFPTWTSGNGQSDIIWYNGTINGSTVTCNVNVSDYNNLTGYYWTHIYAYDIWGNGTSVDAGKTYVPSERERYTITYNGNGGTGEPEPNSDYISVKLSSVRPSKEHYSFIGWATNSSAVSAQYQPGETISPGQSLTLYAVWEKVVILGDADGDDEIGLKDVVQITRYLAGGWDVTVDIAAADVNKDGEVNLKDAVLLRRYLAGGWGVQLA